MKIPFEVEVSESTHETPKEEATPPKSTPQHAPQPTPAVESPKTWSVSALTRKIRMSLEGQFRGMVIEGELSNVKKSPQGHVYLVLKDEGAQIRGIIFRNVASRLPFQIKDGQEVLVKGSVTVYEPRGDYQLQISSIEPKGVGALQLAFEQLKAKLQQEGLFAPQHKKPIPFLPRRIGIITSPTGSVIRDMINVHQRRFPSIPILLYPSAVQGKAATSELVEALQYFNGPHGPKDVDVLIIGRGGGSLEDLWAFNEEPVARAIFGSAIPVISAVGHETDFTIADFVADLRAPTPSAAMELAVPNKKDLEYTLQQKDLQLQAGWRRFYESKRETLDWMFSKLQSPDFIIQQSSQRVDDLSMRLQRQMAQLLSEKQQRLQHCMGMLDSLSPLSVMHRGYAVVQKEGTALVSVEDVHPKDQVLVQLQDGVLEAEVQKISQKPFTSLKL